METPLVPILVPLAAGLLVLCLPDRVRGARAALGVLGTLATLALTLPLLGGAGTIDLGRIGLGPIELRLTFRAEGAAPWLVAFAALLSFLVSLYAVGHYSKVGGAPGRFFGFVLLATAGAAGVLLADHLLILVFFWELVSLSLFLLAVTGRPDAAAASAKTFVLLGVGDMCLLLGVILLGVSGHDLSMTAAPVKAEGALLVVTYLLFVAAAAAKAGFVPLSSWIPTLSTAADAPVMALLPAALDKVLGIWLLVRVSTGLLDLPYALELVLMTLGAITILAAVLMAMAQHDLRRLLSFHAVSQVGYMALGIGTGTVIGAVGAVFHMVNHAIYKSCLFLGAGSVERQAGTTELGKLGGLGRTMPVTFGAMLVASLAIAGIPPLNGFASKWMVYAACLKAGQPVFLTVAIFGSVLTLASFVKVLSSVFWGPRPKALDGVKENGLSVRVPLVTLAALCVLLGAFAALPLDHVAGPAAGLSASAAPTGSSFLSGSAAVYRPLLVTGLLLLGVIGCLALVRAVGSRARRVRPAFMGGEPIDRETNRFPGTEFYRTVTELPGLGPGLAAGDRGAFDLYAIFARIGGWLIAPLRRLHSGLLTDYLAFCLVGLVFLLFALFGS